MQLIPDLSAECAQQTPAKPQRGYLSMEDVSLVETIREPKEMEGSVAPADAMR